MSSYQVGYLVGSLSRRSINRTLARALVRLAPPSLAMVEIPIGELPLYNRDFDEDYPPAGRALKNAIDWASRPWGTNSFARKPSAVIGASTGKIGTAVAQQNLRSILSFCNSPQMNAPEAYVQLTPGLVTEDGEVTDETTEQFLRDFMVAFEGFITRVLTVLPRTT